MASQLKNYAFIDSQNLNLGVQKVGWKMDWRKLLQWLRNHYDVSKAYLFIGHIPEFEDMYVHLHELGYLVVLKPTQDLSRPPTADKSNQKAVKDSAGLIEENESNRKSPIKGNIDAELVLWAMKEFNNYQKAIIVSGDGDFYCLAEYLNENGKLSQIMTPNWQYSSLLKSFDNKIIRLDQNRRQLGYVNRRLNHAKNKQKDSQ